jgi:hypothetical protein
MYEWLNRNVSDQVAVHFLQKLKFIATKCSR